MDDKDIRNDMDNEDISDNVDNEDVSNEISFTASGLDKLIYDNQDWDGALERLKTDKGKKEAKTAFRDGNLPLHLLCFKNPPLKVAEALLEVHPEGANITNSDGLLPLHIACGNGAVAEMVKALLKANLDGIKKKENHGMLPLHIAFKWGLAEEVVSVLLEAYPEGTRNIDEDGNLPTHYVNKDTSLEIVRQLFEAYAGKADDMATQRLLNAVQSGFEYEIWRVLIEAYPGGVTQIDKRGRNPLHILIQDKAPDEVILSILEVYPEGAKMADDDDMFPLQYACWTESSPLLLLQLIEAFPEGAKTTYQEGKLPLHYVCEGGAISEVMQAILDAYPRGIITSDKEGNLPLHVINENTSDEVVDVLVQVYRKVVSKTLPKLYNWEKGIYPKFSLRNEVEIEFSESSHSENRFNHQQLPLQYALKNGAPPKVLHKLLKLYPNGGFYGDELRRLPLHYSFLYGAAREVGEKIRESCRDAIKQVDDDGKHPLHYACREGVAPDVVGELLAAYPESASKADNNGQLPIHHACANKPHAKTLDLLLDAHPQGAAAADVNDDLPIHILFRNDNFNKGEGSTEREGEEQNRDGHSGNDGFVVYEDDDREPDRSTQAGEGRDVIFTVEKFLRLMMSETSACGAVGDVGVFLPLHIASACNVSKEILETLLHTYPEAASRVARNPRKASRYALDLLENTRPQTVSKDNWKVDFNLKSDLLFAFNPNIARWKAEEARLCRLEQRIIDEMIGNAELSEVSRRVWVWMCESDLTTSSVEKILNEVDKNACRALASIKSRTGQRLLVGASPECGRIIRSHLLFVGRYHIARNQRPLHQSPTCVVFRARDFASQMGAPQNESYDLIGSDESVPVVIKFMFYKDQFEREKSARVYLGLKGTKCSEMEQENVNQDFPPLVPLLDEYDASQIGTDSDSQRFKIDRDELANRGEYESLKLKTYDYALVMPEADRTLDSIYRHERPSTNQVRQVMEELGRALNQLHQRDIIHGDIKLLNVVRMKGRISLIDMDAYCRTEKHMDYDEIRDFAGAKFSSGVLPPEMIESLDEEGIDSYEKYWKCEMSTKSEFWKKIRPYQKSSGSEAYVVKTFRGDVKGLPYELVRPSVKIDVWSFGALLLQLSSGDPLFKVNRDDDLISVDDFEKLHNFDKSVLEEVVFKRIDDLLLRDLLEKLLLVHEDRRPDTILEVLEHPFFKVVKDRTEAQEKLDLIKSQVDNQANEDRRRFNAAWEELSSGAAGTETLEALSSFAARYTATPCQPDQINTVDKLLAQADACQSDLHDAMRRIVEAAGGTFLKGPLKQRERINFKAEHDYDGDFRRMVDVVRASGIFDSLSGAKKIFKLLDHDSSGLSTIRCKDRLNNPLPSGYRDVLFNVVLTNSQGPPHVGELQIHLKALEEIKQINHRVYELQRVAEWLP